MPRKQRIEVPDGTFHVATRGVHGETVFASTGERRFHILLLSQAVERFGWVCLAYCQMGTHFHLVLTTPDPTLAAGMQFLNGEYAGFVNVIRDRRGHLFGARYWSTLIETDAHMLETCRYVVLNPVRAGLCERPEQWIWSSFPATVGLVRPPRFLAVERQLGLFDARRDVAQAAYETFVDEGLAANRRSA